MPIKPGKDETQSEWMSRCVPEMIGTGDDKRPQDQAVAICLDIWRNRDKSVKQAAPEPDPGESRDDFMERCLDEVGDEEECRLAWESRSLKLRQDRSGVVQKTHAEVSSGMEFVLSDETPDRMGDVILVSGWKLDNFKLNPIALFNHNANAPIGTWEDVRVDGKRLRGRLKLAPGGTSPRLDEIRRLVEVGILKAVSVGFKALKHELIEDENKDEWDWGYRFLEQELVETSLVSVPANPNAISIAKSLGTSAETISLIFAEQGSRGEARSPRGVTAEQGTKSNRKDKIMSVLSQNIVESQGRINVLTDALKAHHESPDYTGSDADIEKSIKLNADLEHEKRHLASLVQTEKNLGGNTSEDVHTIVMPTRQIENVGSAGSPRVYPEVAKKHQAGDYVWKSLVTLVKLQGDRYRKASALDVLRDTVGENDRARAVFSAIIGKAATVPALTTQVGWAAELVRTEIGAFLASLQPNHIFARLAAKGSTFTFGTNGIISIPMRSATPTIAGSFVGEGAPIPVRQGAFQSIQLTPKKMAVITVFSREISEHSDPAIEGILREAIVEDTAVAIDTVLLDTNAATSVRPAGLRYNLSSLTPTAGGGFTAVVGDVKLLVGALLTSTLGNLRVPVWLMGPDLVLALKLTVAPNGELVFKDEVNGGTFCGFPIIESPTVTADTIYLIDAADFLSVTGTDPRFDVSDSATVHMEDTTPLQISYAGTPGTVAAPTRSFWQTDTLGIRMLMQMNWAQRRAGMTQYVTGVTWN